MRLTAAITQEAGWFVARCLEVEVTSQGESLEKVSRADQPLNGLSVAIASAFWWG